MDKIKNLDKFDVQLITSGELLEKVFFLRHKVFLKTTGREEDEFDKFCSHVAVVDKDTRDVVGTYRLLLRSVADKNRGFFAETRFDLTNIKKNCQGELLEMGRACVDEAYRKYPIINLIWKAIESYVEQHDVRYLFGSSRIDNPTLEKVGQVFKFFKENFYSGPDFRVYPLKNTAYPYAKELKNYNKIAVMRMFSALIKSYLKMGALVCGEPALNKTFGTVNFFMLLDMKKINNSYKGKFL